MGLINWECKQSTHYVKTGKHFVRFSQIMQTRFTSQQSLLKEVEVLSLGFPNWYGKRRSLQAFRSNGLGIILIDQDRTFLCKQTSTLSVFCQPCKLSVFLNNLYENEVIVLSVGFPNWYGNRRSDQPFRSYGLGIILIDQNRTYLCKHTNVLFRFLQIMETR
jgi:hypothetical protein